MPIIAFFAAIMLAYQMASVHFVVKDGVRFVGHSKGCQVYSSGFATCPLFQTYETILDFATKDGKPCRFTIAASTGDPNVVHPPAEQKFTGPCRFVVTKREPDVWYDVLP